MLFYNCYFSLIFLAAAVRPTEPPGASTNVGLIVGIVPILLIVPIILVAVYFIW